MVAIPHIMNVYRNVLVCVRVFCIVSECNSMFTMRADKYLGVCVLLVR